MEGAMRAKSFDAGRFQDEAERSHTLPARWYWDPAVFEREKEAIFYRTWWYAGHMEDVREPGAYMTATVVDQEVVIVRGRDGLLRAFYNVCSHRAHRLLDGKGRRTVIVCPYHNWSYETDGGFKTARGIDGVCDFDREAAGLKPVRVEALENLLFVNLDPNAAPLAGTAADMTRDMLAHCPDLPRLTCAHSVQVETGANWKALVDNDLESYHVTCAHPALADLLDYSTFKVWEHAWSTSHAMDNTKGDNQAYRVSESDVVKRAIYTWLWPNTAFFISPGRANVAVFQMIPKAPERTVQRWDFYFEDKTPNQAERAMIDYTVDILIPEDSALCENVQRGLRSRGYEQGRFVVNPGRPELSEHHVHMFQRLVRNAVLGA
jgi:carnitine monooxygenase subunit